MPGALLPGIRTRRGRGIGRASLEGSQSTNTVVLPTPAFQVNFDTSITPEIGSAGSFSRGTARNYWSAIDTLAAVTANNPAIPAYQFDNDATAGLAMYSGTSNLAVQSEAPGTTWTAVGTGTITNGVGTFFNTTIAFGTIDGASGDGITQTIALSAADKTVLLSFFGQATTGQLTARFTIEGDSGGTPETSTQDVIVTSGEPARYYFTKVFTGAATGNVKISITLRSTAVLRIGGIMLENKETDGTTDQHTRIPGPYIKTTVAAVAHEADILTYPANNISNVSQFTFSIWLNSDWRLFGSSAQYRDLTPSSRDKYAIRVRDASNNIVCELQTAAGDNTIILGLNGATLSALFERHYSRRWNHYIITVDYTNDVYKVYRNGLEVASSTTALTAPGAADTFYIGSPNGYRQWNGIIHKLKYYSSVLSPSQVQLLFQNEVAGHTEATYEHGWPASPNWHDPYTAAFWDFAEASGSIVDKVNALTCTVNGSPTFNTSFSGKFANLSPGITYTTGTSHRKLSDTTALNFDRSTDNIIIEVYLQKTSTVGEQNVFTCLGHGSTTDYGWRIYFSNDSTLKLDIQDDAGNFGLSSWTLPNSLVDGQPHKLRFRFGSNSTVRLWIDEVLQTVEGDNSTIGVITSKGIRVAEKYDGSGSNFIGSLLSLKITKATNDASVILTSNGGPISLGSE